MFALPPEAFEIGDLQPLAEAIEGLCAILDGDREAVIEGLAEILRRRTAFEALKRHTQSSRDALKDLRV
ncbi:MULTISPECIES: hypothetical protein [Methylobacterium]|jgi:hypothetical protein|uniref:Uncharacterized protein n=1 Tax=Methylobacterium brachiatum TaxID=269660 RepID=A0AAJ1WW15_9HYPH|nr:MULTISPECIES: hypothetical protein [Methylobacterium]MBN6824488.1 hypothetical protein [Methylobacterium organophilum]MBX9933379.1 hypothetical protein [Methylobacterium sp.]MCB4803968.1 hypothetical protein [Methylobacterium brachiatum]MDE4914398.1 hypothetical protein [Methylobacterium sp. 092160098-2]MDQ0542775.1 hypothetical protein [Methylobacterium brachiatum]